MTLTHLKIFIKVYQLENITHAAEQLNMTQPAVSRAIKELERYYNVCLFERINRRLHRTECANQLYAMATHISGAFEIMEEQLNSWNNNEVLRIGATVSFGNFLIPDLVSKFKETNPKCKVKVLISNGKQLQEALIDSKIDLALVESGFSSSELNYEPFINDKLVLIVPAEHELTKQETININDLANYEILTREIGSAVRYTTDHYFRLHNLQISPLWESSSTQAIVRAVKLGLGIALLPEDLVKEAIERNYVKSCNVINEKFERRNYIVWHKHKFFTPAANNFIKICKEYIKNH